MTALQVAQHPASVDAYMRHGWSLVPIPHGTKGPETKGWNLKENTLKSQHQLPPYWGIGLAHAYSGTMAVDIDVWDRAVSELRLHGIDLQALYDAPDAVVVDSGKQGHGKLLYRMPFGLALQSKKLIDTDPQGKRYNYLDLRCGTANGLTVQDVLPPSIHPDTNQPYRWAGRGHWTRLPPIPQSLLALWTSLLEQDRRPTIPNDTPIPASWEEIASALHFISPDCSREEWISVGMALHFAGHQANQLERALTMWDEWSQPSNKYPGERDLLIQWRSFRSDKANQVRLGTLFRMATRAGWVKPVPDVTGMFKQIEVITPVQLTTNLRPPPPQLDMDLVPKALRNYATKIARSVGCDPMIPLFSGIAAVSGALDARTRLELKPGFKVPPVVWFMTIGEPAGKKSHGASPMFKILHTLEAEDRPRYARELQIFEAMEARHEGARKAYLDAARDTEAMLSGELPPGYGDPPAPPVAVKLLIQDTTSQKLVRQAADRPRGMLAHMDEMLRWAEKTIDKTSGEDRSAWTQAYEAAWYQMDRVGSGTITCENFAISVYGNLQPEGFRTVMQGMSKDGMLQRFIPVMVQSERSHKGRPDRDTVEQEAYEMMIRVAFGLPAMTYTLTDEAFKAYDEFQDWYYAKLEDERLLRPGPIFMTAFGKLEGLVGRLALLWHVMSEPYSTRIGATVIRQAIEVIRTYVIPSMRYVYEGEVNGFDQWVADYVIQYADQPSLKLSEVRRSARRQLEGVSQWGQVDKILSAMHVLEQAGWVLRIDDESKVDQAQWAVNADLKTMFSEHRRRTIKAKQNQMDEIYKLSTKAKPKVHGYEGAEAGEDDDAMAVGH